MPADRHSRWRLVLPIAALSLACAALRPARTPMPRVVFAAGETADTLVVLLPGRLSEPRDFERRGLLTLVREARPDADVMAVDAHLGYYRAGVIRERLWHDVLEPASRRYREVWLVGVSLGGVGALAMTASHGDVLSGVVVLAPYLGPDSLIDEIEAAGGAAGWGDSRQPTDPIEDMWVYFRDRDVERAGPPVFLGFGGDDRRARDHRLFGELLPARRVIELPGGHRWPVWADLLQELIARGALASTPR